MTTTERRVADRVNVPGAQVLCATRGWLGWKMFPVPFHVCDLGTNGMSFRNFGTRLATGLKVRLIILLPKASPITVKGEVIWNKELNEDAANGSAQHTHACGIKFMDYEADAWTVLSSVLSTPPAPAPKKRKQPLGVERALEVFSKPAEEEPVNEIPLAEGSAEIRLA